MNGRSPADERSCACRSPEARFQQFEQFRDVGVDLTDGRYGDVNVRRCVACGTLWLDYRVEYEAFSRSGRWARGLIEEPLASTLQADEAVAYLHALDEYLYGGSYFDGLAGKRSGRMPWGP